MSKGKEFNFTSTNPLQLRKYFQWIRFFALTLTSSNGMEHLKNCDKWTMPESNMAEKRFIGIVIFGVLILRFMRKRNRLDHNIT